MAEISKKRHCFLYLNLHLRPEDIDQNCHPAKAEVRHRCFVWTLTGLPQIAFLNEKQVFALVESSLVMR
jgi:hypothetical protein